MKDSRPSAKRGGKDAAILALGQSGNECADLNRKKTQKENTGGQRDDRRTTDDNIASVLDPSVKYRLKVHISNIAALHERCNSW